MKPEIKVRWTEALRSGEYSQTTNCLRDESGYCCLGVLTDLAVKDGVIGPWELDSLDGQFSATYHDSEGFDCGEEAVLPPPVIEWAGLDSSNPHVRLDEDEYPVPISDPNDNGYEFNFIADLIDRQL